MHGVQANPNATPIIGGAHIPNRVGTDIDPPLAGQPGQPGRRGERHDQQQDAEADYHPAGHPLRQRRGWLGGPTRRRWPRRRERRRPAVNPATKRLGRPEHPAGGGGTRLQLGDRVTRHQAQVAGEQWQHARRDEGDDPGAKGDQERDLGQGRAAPKTSGSSRLVMGSSSQIGVVTKRPRAPPRRARWLISGAMPAEESSLSRGGRWGSWVLGICRRLPGRSASALTR